MEVPDTPRRHQRRIQEASRVLRQEEGDLSRSPRRKRTHTRAQDQNVDVEMGDVSHRAGTRRQDGIRFVNTGESQLYSFCKTCSLYLDASQFKQGLAAGAVPQTNTEDDPFQIASSNNWNRTVLAPRQINIVEHHGLPSPPTTQDVSVALISSITSLPPPNK